MHVITGEVAPLAPLLIPIGEILIWAVALAFCLLATYIARALFGTLKGAVGWIPFLGRVSSQPITSVEQKIVSFLSGAAQSADAKMGAAFHELARVIDWLGEEIARHANLLATLATLIVGQSFVGTIHLAINAVRALVRGVGHTASVAIHRIETLEKRLARQAVADVLPRVGRLEREIGHAVEWDIPALRRRSVTIERSLDRLWQRIRRLDKVIVDTAFVGAVAVALGRMGLGWLRCNSVRNIGKRLGCGGFGALEGLLFEAGVAVLATDICDVAGVTAEAAMVLRPVLMELVDVENALVGCHGATRPPALRLSALSLPPVPDPLPLAA